MRFKEWALAVVITLLTIWSFKATTETLKHQQQITNLQFKVVAMETKLFDTATDLKRIQREFIPRNEIQTLLEEIEGYRLKVDDMVMSYYTLDEILRNLFSYEQEQYMRGR